jgi:hypothetical protein
MLAPPRHIARVIAAVAFALTARAVVAQPESAASTERIPCPKLWDSSELVDWATPVVGAGGPPRYYSEQEYYATPVDNLRTYPVYHPDREPEGYWEWLHQQEPAPLIETGVARTTAEWREAGRRVFDELDVFFFRSDDAAAIAWMRDPDAIAGDPPVVTKDGEIPFYRWVVEKRGQVMLSMANCASCHQRVLDDGTLVRGAPSNLLVGAGVPLAAVLAAAARFDTDPAARTTPGESFYEEFGVPWLEDDVHARYREATSDAELGALANPAPVPGVFARFNGSPFGTSSASPTAATSTPRERTRIEARRTWRGTESWSVSRTTARSARTGSCPRRGAASSSARRTTRCSRWRRISGRSSRRPTRIRSTSSPRAVRKCSRRRAAARATRRLSTRTTSWSPSTASGRRTTRQPAACT